MQVIETPTFSHITCQTSLQYKYFHIHVIYVEMNTQRIGKHLSLCFILYCCVYSKIYWRILNLTCKEVPWQCTLPRVQTVSTGLPARNSVKIRLSSCLRTTHLKIIGSEGEEPRILNLWRGHHYVASTPRTIRTRYPFQSASKGYQ